MHLVGRPFRDILHRLQGAGESRYTLKRLTSSAKTTIRLYTFFNLMQLRPDFLPVGDFFPVEQSIGSLFKLGGDDDYLVNWQSVVFPLANRTR